MFLQRHHLVEFLIVVYFFILCFFDQVSATEVTAGSSIVDDSLGFEINLPLLTCHAKYIGYKEVRWYKDFKLVKNGSSELSSHMLSLSSLIDNDDITSPYSNPLKLQGYYWCETDYVVPSETFKYLFKIYEVHTFVGRMISKKDSFGDDDEISLEDKIRRKTFIYESEMQEILFGFLPHPNTFVTDVQLTKEGLEVHFYLYVRQLFRPRQPYDNELVEDWYQMTYVLEYLNNETITSENLYRSMLDWMGFRGINVSDINLKSTLGCYEEKSLVAADPPIKVTWPFARIGEIVIPTEGCSSKNGLAVIRMCTGAFDTGAQWGNPSGKCDKPATGLTMELKKLYDSFGDENKSTYIKKIQTLIKDPLKLTVPDLHILAKILKELSEVPELNQQEVDGVFSIIDSLLETKSSELMAAKSTIRLTGRILQVINNIMFLATQQNKELFISKRHLLLDTKATDVLNGTDLILGVAVESSKRKKSLRDASITFLKSNTKIPLRKSLAFYLLPPDLIHERESELSLPCLVNTMYFDNWLLFPNPKDKLVKRHYKVLPTPVMYASLSGGPAWGLEKPVEIYFKNTFYKKIENPVCVHYEPRLSDGNGGWSTEGCEYGGLKDGFYKCRCHHLSIFAVILSENPDPRLANLKLGTAVYVGCGASIIALSFTVLLYLLSKHWRSTVDHHVLFCLALSFLCCVVLIFVSEIHFKRKWSCLILAMVLHYSIFSILGWLLVLSVIYQLRFAKKTDVAEIPYFMLKAAFCVWGAALIIVLLMALTKDYNYHEVCLPTVSEVSKTSVIPVALILLITLCVNSCAAYAVTCRFRKDFLIDDSTFTEPAIKFRVSFTIFLSFVATWLFGFFSMHGKYEPPRILFSICIALTAYYVALFFVFHEISLWALCRKWKQKEPESIPAIPPVRYENKSYKAIEKQDQPQ